MRKDAVASPFMNLLKPIDELIREQKVMYADLMWEGNEDSADQVLEQIKWLQRKQAAGDMYEAMF